MNPDLAERFPELETFLEPVAGEMCFRLPDRVGWEKGAGLAAEGLLGLALIGIALAGAMRAAPPLAAVFLAVLGFGMFGATILKARQIRRGARLCVNRERVRIERERFFRVETVEARLDQIGLSTATGRGIEIVHPSGRARVGTSLDAQARDALSQFLDELMRCASVGTPARNPGARGEIASAVARTSEQQEFPYQPRVLAFAILLVFLVGFAGYAGFMGYTNKQGVVLKGLSLGPFEATLLYWVLCAASGTLAIVALCKFYQSWANPRRLLLYPDRLEVVEENTDRRRILAFADLKDVQIEMYRDMQMALVLHHPEGKFRIERSLLRTSGDFETLRDTITGGFARHARP